MYPLNNEESDLYPLNTCFKNRDQFFNMRELNLRSNNLGKERGHAIDRARAKQARPSKASSKRPFFDTCQPVALIFETLSMQGVTL